MSETPEDPTREQCISDFWDIIGPGLVDLMRAGKIDPEQYRRLPEHLRPTA